MADVSRVVAIWSGFPGEPGYSKFSFLPLADDTARNAAGAQIRTFFDAIKAYLPRDLVITVQPQVDNLDTVTGDLVASATMSTAPAPVVGSGPLGGPYAGGSGFVVTWLAGGVFAGRRIRGRTFIVPASDVFSADGTLAPTPISVVQTAGNALCAATGADFAIWNRDWSKATPPVPISGLVTSATSCVVRDAASQLRSRRR